MTPKRILVADDDPQARKILRTCLESRTQFSVCGEAVDGVEAIEKARALSPDLVVMDWSMPIMNGIDAGAVLKTMPPKLPIVMYTAHDSSMIETHALAVGIRAVFEKHDMAGLIGHLRHLLL